MYENADVDVTGDNRLEPELARINARQDSRKDERAAKHHKPRTDLEHMSNKVSVCDGDCGRDDEDEDEVARGSVILVLYVMCQGG